MNLEKLMAECGSEPKNQLKLSVPYRFYRDHLLHSPDFNSVCIIVYFDLLSVFGYTLNSVLEDVETIYNM